jgi:GMP synthase (glutamine-hydrolysing)
LSDYDAVFIGGSGRYSATTDEPWLLDSLGFLQDLAISGQPVFASCWGFQALSRALGGEVVHDLTHAELGTKVVSLTERGKTDPVFGSLVPTFPALMGHEDCVVRMPDQAELLAVSDRANQAFRLRGLPVYGTQFHPELTLDSYFERVRAYPTYIQKITGLELREFKELCSETPESGTLIGRFIDHCT